MKRTFASVLCHCFYVLLMEQHQLHISDLFDLLIVDEDTICSGSCQSDGWVSLPQLGEDLIARYAQILLIKDDLSSGHRLSSLAGEVSSG